jgi:hypothetical protein
MSLNGSDSGNEIIFISIIKKLKPISIYFETFHRSELVNKTLKIYFNRPDSFISCFTFLGFNFARSFSFLPLCVESRPQVSYRFGWIMEAAL